MDIGAPPESERGDTPFIARVGCRSRHIARPSPIGSPGFDPDIKEGDVLTLIWGEPDGGTDETATERHRQAEIRVRVSPVPYARLARESYAAGSWRTRAA